LLHSDLAEFRLQVANNCGNCHADLSSRYALSMHGQLTHQGYAALSAHAKAAWDNALKLYPIQP
jgi:hypothetical protein